MNINIIELLKLPINIIAAISVASGLILFIPDNIAEKIYMNNFRESYGFIIGITFIISISIIIVSITKQKYTDITEKHTKRKFLAKATKHLSELEILQKGVIYYMYQDSSHTIKLPINDYNTQFLENKLIIRKSSNQAFIDNFSDPKIPFILQPWVIDELNKNENLRNEFKQIYNNLNNQY